MSFQVLRLVAAATKEDSCEMSAAHDERFGGDSDKTPKLNKMSKARLTYNNNWRHPLGCGMTFGLQCPNVPKLYCDRTLDSGASLLCLKN